MVSVAIAKWYGLRSWYKLCLFPLLAPRKSYRIAKRDYLHYFNHPTPVEEAAPFLLALNPAQFFGTLIAVFAIIRGTQFCIRSAVIVIPPGGKSVNVGFIKCKPRGRRRIDVNV